MVDNNYSPSQPPDSVPLLTTPSSEQFQKRITVYSGFLQRVYHITLTFLFMAHTPTCTMPNAPERSGEEWWPPMSFGREAAFLWARNGAVSAKENARSMAAVDKSRARLYSCA